jgi:hypothetical protein
MFKDLVNGTIAPNFHAGRARADAYVRQRTAHGYLVKYRIDGVDLAINGK